MKRKICPMGECENCIWFQPWDTKIKDQNGGDTGRVKREDECSIMVLLATIPKIQGAIDGLQGGVNEARNRSMEAKKRVEDFGNGINQVVLSIETALNQVVETNRKLLEG